MSYKDISVPENGENPYITQASQFLSYQSIFYDFSDFSDIHESHCNLSKIV